MTGNACRVLQVALAVVIVNFPVLTDSKGQYVMPILGGMKMSVAYDVANLFIRPIAASICVFLSFAMLFILFFGVITSPFGYIFGIPSRKYVLGGTDAAAHPAPAKSRSFDFEHWNGTLALRERMDEYRSKHLSFEEQVFILFPPELHVEECKLLALCHAHNSITRLPMPVLKTVKFFSEKLIELSPSHMEAIKRGIRFEEDCSEVYSGCKDSGYTVVVKTLLHWLPPSLKNHNHRRKKAMYM